MPIYSASLDPGLKLNLIPSLFFFPTGIALYLTSRTAELNLKKKAKPE